MIDTGLEKELKAIGKPFRRVLARTVAGDLLFNVDVPAILPESLKYNGEPVAYTVMRSDLQIVLESKLPEGTSGNIGHHSGNIGHHSGNIGHYAGTIGHHSVRVERTPVSLHPNCKKHLKKAPRLTQNTTCKHEYLRRGLARPNDLFQE